MFRAEKTMFRPPGDVSQAARILGNNYVCRQEPRHHKQASHSRRLLTTGKSASRSKAGGEAGFSVGVVLDIELSGVQLH